MLNLTQEEKILLGRSGSESPKTHRSLLRRDIWTACKDQVQRKSFSIMGGRSSEDHRVAYNNRGDKTCKQYALSQHPRRGICAAARCLGIMRSVPLWQKSSGAQCWM